MRKNKNVGVLILLLFVGVITSAYFLIQKNKVANNRISAEVINIEERPNMAEDGYYAITVQDANNKRYIVDATGNMNSWVPPEENGVACVSVRDVKVGDKVTFNLPKAESQKNTYVICHEESLGGYYFNVE